MKLSWSDRRRLRRVTNPSDMDWNALADKLLLTTVVVVVLFFVLRHFTVEQEPG